MIWIATLFLLAVAVWLFNNGLNEKRWVEAHAHDDAVASDPGILPDLSAIARSASSGIEGRVSIHEENSVMSRGIARIDARTAKWRDKVEDRVKRAHDEPDFFERFSARVNDVTRGVDERIERRLQAERENAQGERRSVTEEDSFIGRATARIMEKGEALGDRISSRHHDDLPPADEKVSLMQEKSFAGRVARAMSRRTERWESGLEARVARARNAPDRSWASDGPQDDLAGQVASKLGERLNAMDENTSKR